MSKEKPKKGGMVLIIGMGAKPKKEKDGVKKADDMTAPRKRGGLGNRERKRLYHFKNKMRANPNLLEETLSKLKIPEKMFRMYLQKVEGKSLEEAKNSDTNFPKLIDEVKRINNANLGQFDETGNVKNKKLQESMQRQGIRLKDFKQSIEDDPFMNFQDRMAKLRSERGPRITLDRAPRRRVGQKKKRNPKGDMFEIPDDTEEEKPKPKTPFYTPMTPLEEERRKRTNRLYRLEEPYGYRHRLDSDESYKDLYSQMFQGIEEAEANDPRVRDKKDKFTDFEGDEVGSDEHFRMLERLFQANQPDPTEAALRELGQGGGAVSKPKFPLKTVQGRVQSQPSTIFQDEHVSPFSKLPSPQDDDDIATSSDSRNVMDHAWVLLKGAMKTIDLIAQETNTMEEALESMKQSFPNMPSQQAIQLITQARNQQARERMQEPVANIIDSSPQEMMDLNPGMKNFASPTGNLDDVATSSDSRNVMDAAWGLLKGNPEFRDAEGRAINHPAAMVYDDLATQIHLNEIGPNDFIDDPDDETAADRMEQMRNPTHQKKLMRRLKEGKYATPLHLRMAMRRDEENKRNLDKYREEAREQTRNTMEFGNEDESPSPQYGIKRMPHGSPPQPNYREEEGEMSHTSNPPISQEEMMSREGVKIPVSMKEGNIMDQM
tara:strand:- start:705 stop:2684 length:1980 start_codon:yes stop_codon:yes gene_type:complete